MWRPLEQTAADLDRLKADGIMTVRFDINWSDLEPSPDGWNTGLLAKLDAILTLMDARGIAPILLLLETPAWARYNAGSAMTPPDNPNDYGRAIGYLAARYAGRPHMVWEVWNEPNDPRFWQTPTGPDPTTYTRLLQSAYTHIKGADPDATVLGGAIVFNDLPFLKGMYAAGARGFFDALSLHPYNQGHDPAWTQLGREWFSFTRTVTDMERTMAEHGEPNKPIWITEMGWSTSEVSHTTRVTYLKRAIALVRSWPYVRAFCVYAFTAADEIVADKPVSYLRLDERHGTTAADSTGRYAGTIVGDVTLGLPGALASDTNTAMAFGGATGYVGVVDSPSLNPAGDLTVEAWAKPATLDGATHAIVHKGAGASSDTWQYRLTLHTTNQWRGCLYSGATGDCVVAPGIASTTEWTHLVLTYSGSTLTLYVNGMSVGTTTVSASLTRTSGMLAIGRAGSYAAHYFNGGIDEVAIYDRALPAARVQAHYGAAISGDANPWGPIRF
jgi:hypothetical protein